MHGHAWPCMARHGHIWPSMAMHGQHGHIWPSMAMHGHAWPDMAMYGHIWPCKAMYGHVWPDMAIISSKRHSKSKKSCKISENPKSRILFRCVKLRENPENQGFAFFGFLPPYLGVSDSLAYFKRRDLKRSIVSYKKLLISCLVARYSAFFVFKSMEIHGNQCRSTRSTLQN